MDSTFEQDIQNIVGSNNIPWEKIEGKTILITGASGLVGAHLTHALAKRGGKVLAVGRNLEKLQSLPAIPVKMNDITEPLEVEDGIDYIIHCASPTQSKDFVQKPVEVAKAVIHGTTNMLDLAVQKEVESVVFLSSVEVYGLTDKYPITETDLGHIDLANPRSSYPQSKRMAENLCACYYTQYGLPVKIARLTQTFGSGVAYDDNRLFAQFARAAYEKKDIVLHTKGATVRNYCYISDTVCGILTVMLKGGDGEIYNIADGGSECSIAEMAETVAALYGINIIYDLSGAEARGYLNQHKTVISAAKLEGLGWSPNTRSGQKSIITMYERLLEHWRETYGA